MMTGKRQPSIWKNFIHKSISNDSGTVSLLSSFYVETTWNSVSRAENSWDISETPAPVLAVKEGLKLMMKKEYNEYEKGILPAVRVLTSLCLRASFIRKNPSNLTLNVDYSAYRKIRTSSWRIFYLGIRGYQNAVDEDVRDYGYTDTIESYRERGNRFSQMDRYYKNTNSHELGWREYCESD